jgi:CHAD domain-containing protein
MAEGKWISGVDAETPAHRAARHVLALRLQLVRQRLPGVLEEIQADTEHVHQLRVATRRADAAVRIFRDYLPSKVFKKARRRLRRLRRAAGEARDWDVFVTEVLERMSRQPEKQRPGLDFLHGCAVGRRTAAQEELTAVSAEELSRADAWIADALAAVHPSAAVRDGTLLQVALPLLRSLLLELEELASGDLTDYTRLHQVRIRGKRLRYAMEVFAGAFPPLFTEQLYPQIEAIQEVLGRANDSHVAIGHLEMVRDQLQAVHPATWPRLKPGIDSLLQWHRRRLPQDRRRFLRDWKEWQTSELRSAWSSLLAEPAISPAV